MISLMTMVKLKPMFSNVKEAKDKLEAEKAALESEKDALESQKDALEVQYEAAKESGNTVLAEQLGAQLDH